MFKRFFSCQTILKPEQIMGELPSDRQIVSKTLSVAWPSMMESIFISLISSVDLIMVGGIGANAIAAVGITNQPKFIILAVILSLNVAVTVIVSRRKGEQNQDSANRCLRNAIVLSFIFSLVLSFLGFLYAKEILSLAGANADYIDLAVNYFKIIMIGNFFYGIGLTITAAQRGIGNTKISMRTNLTANVVNLIFNYLLINGIGFFPQLGVTGAAIATMLGNICAFAMAVYSVRHPEGFLYIARKQNWAFDKKTLKDLYKIASSAFVEQVFMRIGFFAYTKTVASLGTLAFATHQVCMNIINLSFSVGDGLSIATSSLVGVSLGSKRKDLAIIYCKTTQRIGKLIGVILCVLMVIFRKECIQLFSPDPQIIELGSQIIFIIAATIFFQITQVITFGCLRGAGDVRFTAITSLASVTVIRPILTYVLAFPLGFGLIGAWVSLFLDQLVRFFASQIRFKQGKWVHIKI